MTREEIIERIERYIPWADEYEVDIEVLTGALELLKKEPCDDAISREAVMLELDKYLCGVPFDEKGIDIVIKELPPVNPQEPKTGHWMNRGKQGEVLPFYMRYECSICGETADKSNYCPNCGCRMVEPQESEEISERNMKMWQEIFKAESEDKEVKV